MTSELLQTGEVGQRTLIKAAVTVVDIEALADVFLNPLSAPLSDIFLDALPANAERFGSAIAKIEKGENPTRAAAKRSTSAIVPGKITEEERSLFGLFRSSAAFTVFQDAVPLFIVTLYSIWGEVTQRMMALIQVKRIFVWETQTVEGRWLYDMRFQVFHGDHLIVAVIGIMGLAIWSVGFLLVLFGKLHANRHRLSEKDIITNFGYFYNGLEPHMFWWDIVAKKFDILCLYFISFTEVFHDPRAKLIMYLGFAGMFWAAHSISQPFDGRQNQLANRLEGDGLSVRFLTLFILQCLLVLNSNPVLNVVIATSLIAINAMFLAKVVFLLLMEISGGSEEAEARQQLASQGAKKAAAMINIKGGNPLRQLLIKIGYKMLTFFFKPIIALVFKLAAMMLSLRGRVAKEVPHVVWNGWGHNFVILTPAIAEGERKCFDLITPWMQRMYRLFDDDQRCFLSHIVSKFVDHVLTTAECQQLPSCIMDILFGLPGALKAERASPSAKPLPFHLRVAQRIGQVVPVTANPVSVQVALTTKSSFSHGQELPSTAATAEDLNAALMFIQHLSTEEVLQFLEEASRQAPVCDERCASAGADIDGKASTLQLPSEHEAELAVDAGCIPPFAIIGHMQL